MGQYFDLVNLTLRQHGSIGGVKFGEGIYCNHDDIEGALSEVKFPERLPEKLLITTNIPRSHLGLLSLLPVELMDEIFEQLSLPIYVADLAAAHPMLAAQGFAHVVRIRAMTMKDISWCRSHIVLVGDYLYHPENHDLFLPDDIRLDLEKRRLEEENGDYSEPAQLYSYADDHFSRPTWYGDPCTALQIWEYEAMSDLDLSPAYSAGITHIIDTRRRDRILMLARPTLPSSKTAVLCNFTKRQVVRGATLRKVQSSYYARNHLDIGTATLFLTTCTDDWSFLPSKEGEEDESEIDSYLRTVIGKWAGDCIAVVRPEDVEEGMTDITEQVVGVLTKFAELDRSH